MKSEEIEKPGKLIIPPEIRKELKSKRKKGYRIIDYNEYSKLDTIKDDGYYGELEDSPAIYLYGHTSEMHRWGSELKETDFFKQVNRLKKCEEENKDYNIIIGIRRTNFHRLGDIIKFIAETRNEPHIEFPEFNIRPLYNISLRFRKYLEHIKKKIEDDNIELRITDDKLEEFLIRIEDANEILEKNICHTLSDISRDNSLKEESELIPHEIENFDKIRKYIEFGKSISVPEKKAHEIFLGDDQFDHNPLIGISRDDFLKRMKVIKRDNVGKKYKISIGVTRTNFYRLHKILDMIHNSIKNSKEYWNTLPIYKRIISVFNPEYDLFPINNKKFPELNINNLKNIKEIFYKYLSVLNSNSFIGFEIIDNSLDDFLKTVEETAKSFENNLLRTIGTICKDVFTGPRWVLFNLNGTCNTDCVYCRRFSALIDKKERKEMARKYDSFSLDFDVVQSVLKDAKEMGTERILLVGEGEPTMYPHFKEVVQDIKNNGLTFNLSTNGSLIHRHLDALTDGTCNTITVSMSWATEKSFSKIRPGTTKKHIEIIERNVKKLSELKRKKSDKIYEERGKIKRGMVLPSIIILHAISSYNYFDVINMAKQAVRLGADTIWYQLTHLEPFSEKELYLTEKQMKKVKKDLVKAKKICDENGIHFASFIDYELDHYHTEKGDWSVNALLKEGCHVGWHFSYIDLDSVISFCCGMRKIWFIKEGKGLKEAWYSDTYRRYRNDGLIMHRENPLDLFGKPLYGSFCESCDNHDQNTFMIGLITDYGLNKFVER